MAKIRDFIGSQFIDLVYLLTAAWGILKGESAILPLKHERGLVQAMCSYQEARPAVFWRELLSKHGAIAMLKKTLLFTLMLLALSGCSSKPKALKAPCTYNNRTQCGPIIPMQQIPNTNLPTTTY